MNRVFLRVFEKYLRFRMFLIRTRIKINERRIEDLKQERGYNESVRFQYGDADE